MQIRDLADPVALVDPEDPVDVDADPVDPAVADPADPVVPAVAVVDPVVPADVDAEARTRAPTCTKT